MPTVMHHGGCQQTVTGNWCEDLASLDVLSEAHVLRLHCLVEKEFNSFL